MLRRRSLTSTTFLRFVIIIIIICSVPYRIEKLSLIFPCVQHISSNSILSTTLHHTTFMENTMLKHQNHAGHRFYRHTFSKICRIQKTRFATVEILIQINLQSDESLGGIVRTTVRAIVMRIEFVARIVA